MRRTLTGVGFQEKFLKLQEENPNDMNVLEFNELDPPGCLCALSLLEYVRMSQSVHINLSLRHLRDSRERDWPGGMVSEPSLAITCAHFGFVCI